MHRTGLVLWIFCATLFPFDFAQSSTISIEDSCSRMIVRLHDRCIDSLAHSLGPDWRSQLDIIAIDRPSASFEVLIPVTNYRMLSGIDPDLQIVSQPYATESRSIDDQYLNPAEVSNLLYSIEMAYPSIARRQLLGTTEGGYPIYGLKISDSVNLDENEPCIALMGTHQAREIMPVEICCDAASYLTTQYTTDPEIGTWVDNFEIWIIPLVNPEGNAYCWSTDCWWIKNRRNNGDGTFGVDLGHNYPFKWGACFGSSDFPGSSAYRGPSAASEPEVRAIVDLFESRRFIAALSYHSFDEMVLSPYGCYGDYTPDRTAIRSIGNEIASVIQKDDGSMGYQFGTWWEMLYSNDGNETDWLYSQKNVFSYAVEVNTAYQPPYSIRNQTVQRNRLGWRKLFNLAFSGPQIKGKTLDACTGLPLEATVEILQIPLTEDEAPRTSASNTGDFQRFVVPGNYTISAQADGYVGAVQSIHVEDEPYALDLLLVPVEAHGVAFSSFIVDDTDGDHDFVLDPGETARLGICLEAPALRLSGVTAHLSASDPYVMVLDADADFPDIESGQTGWAEGDCFQIWASPLTPENYVVTLALTVDANETVCGNEVSFVITVCSTSYQCPFWLESMDSDPDWTIQNGDSMGWEFGVPNSGPYSAYSGLYVYGTNLDGNYSNGPYYLTTQPINCSGLIDTELRYARYLQNENFFDLARVDISSNGFSWNTIWSGYAMDGVWTQMSHDISQYADGHDSIRIRFSLIPDTTEYYLGFYLDDVEICGSYDGPLPTPFTPTPYPTSTPTGNQTAPWSPTPSPTGSVPSTETPTNSPTIPSPTWTAPPPSPSSTTTSSPTNSPSPSITAPAPTSTSTSSSTPSFTPTQAPPTAPPTSPATSTPQPTATPVEDFIADLTLNDTDFTAFESFELRLKLQNNASAVQGSVYILLDVFGDYYFWPSWSKTLDFKSIFFPSGYSEVIDVLEFTWPQIESSFSNLIIWSGCLESGTSELLGNIDSVTFAYH